MLALELRLQLRVCARVREVETGRHGYLADGPTVINGERCWAVEWENRSLGQEEWVVEEQLRAAKYPVVRAGQRVRILRGTQYHSLHDGMKVAKRTYTITTSRDSRDYDNDVHWSGKGGYWCSVRKCDVEVLG